MRLILTAAALAAACLIAPAPALATTQMPGASVLANTMDAPRDIVAVKYKAKHFYKHRYKGRPPGWSRGKAWWKRGGRGVPPGHWR